MNFWQSGTGSPILGTPDLAFVKDFALIPNNTMAPAKIELFHLQQKQNEYTGVQKFYEIVWKIASGDYAGREVTQKIKAFDNDPKNIDRALNMLKLIMTLCNFKPLHNEAPTNQDLMQMHGKILGIKIREWQVERTDGKGFAEGNFVSEVHPMQGFVAEVGVKLPDPIKTSPVDSAMSRNPRVSFEDGLNDDIPF